MEYSFFIVVEGTDPKIYRVPRQRTARLISEFADQEIHVYDTLQEAKRAALAIAGRALDKAKSGITQFLGQPITQNKDMRTRISELTEDRVQTYHV